MSLSRNFATWLYSRNEATHVNHLDLFVFILFSHAIYLEHIDDSLFICLAFLRYRFGYLSSVSVNMYSRPRTKEGRSNEIIVFMY